MNEDGRHVPETGYDAREKLSCPSLPCSSTIKQLSRPVMRYCAYCPPVTPATCELSMILTWNESNSSFFPPNQSFKAWHASCLY